MTHNHVSSILAGVGHFLSSFLLRGVRGLSLQPGVKVSQQEDEDVDWTIGG